MEEFEQTMTEEDIEHAVVSYGTDMAKWPGDLRANAAQFAGTSAGKSVLEKLQALDKLTMLAKQDRWQSGNVDAFLGQLKAIPDDFSQQQESIASIRASSRAVGTFVDRLFDPVRLWSPAGLVSQGVFASALLFAGLMVGVNAAGTESFDDYDISAGLFDTSEQDYSIDG